MKEISRQTGEWGSVVTYARGELITISFEDIDGNEVMYFRQSDGYWSQKSYFKKPDGSFRESFVKTCKRYERHHEYDPKSGRLLDEWDSTGSRDLLSRRQKYNPADTEISLYNEKKQKAEKKYKPLF